MHKKNIRQLFLTVFSVLMAIFCFSSVAYANPLVVSTSLEIAGFNLVPNPSLETAAADPGTPAQWSRGNWGTNTAVFTYPAAGYDGNSAASVQITAYTNGDAKWYFEPVAITPGTYQFSDYYKSDVKTYLVAQYQTSTGNLSYTNILSLAPAADWTRAMTAFTVPAGTAKITIFHLINNTGTLTVDNYSLQSYSIPTPPPPTPGNLVLNPSFEYADANGQPTGWLQGAWGNNTSTLTYPVAGYNGNGASVNIISYTDGDAKWYFTPVEAKGVYRYSFSSYYKSDIASIVEAQIMLQDGTYQYTRLGNLAPAANWTQFTGTFATPPGTKSMTIFHVINGNGTLSVDEYKLSEIGSAALSQGIVSINFDDGWKSGYTYGYPQFKALGMKTTHYLITDGFNDPANYITLAQAKAIQAAGGEIGSHTKTHADLTTLDSTQLANEISVSKKWFAARCLNVSTFAYPFGSYNSTVTEAIKKAGYAGARSSDPGYNNKASDKYILKMQSVENTTTFEQVKQWIDSAKINKTWLILLFHKVQPDTAGEQYSATPNMVGQIAGYLMTQKIPVVTNSQGLKLISQ